MPSANQDLSSTPAMPSASQDLPSTSATPSASQDLPSTSAMPSASQDLPSTSAMPSASISEIEKLKLENPEFYLLSVSDESSETSATELKNEKRSLKKLFDHLMDEQDSHEHQEAVATINNLRHQLEETKRDLESVKKERDELLLQKGKLEKENAT
ncbi:hypothetical protein Pcinc_015130 [Petrolisthes cinctipes]|uniref:Uncharacterized protein n=1 Tax=Petrolisthes cinctipes TaxID=88211 RepID=A0AAE1FTR0_PETCI|nr:hypothetical protein Pcinc_015130 [Petrolisthes cinctipes]